jgi:predicted small lipoprotein YifL
MNRSVRALVVTAVLALIAVLAGCGASAPDPIPAPADRVPPPVSIDIPKISASSSLISLGVDENQVVETPSVHTPEQAGYYAFSPKPGDPGPAVILGHVDGDGKPGIFYHLKTLKRGDEISR